MREPLWLCLEIVELRQFARTVQAVEKARTDQEMPDGPLVRLIFEFEHELVKERRIQIVK